MVGTYQAVQPGADDWRRALIRARARAYELEFVREVITRGYFTNVWRVASASEPGSYRYVSLTRLSDGWAITCDCPAGQHDKPCVHAALALREVGVLSDSSPLVVAA